jgi:hypothetical protein
MRCDNFRSNYSLHDLRETPNNFVYASSQTYHAIHTLAGKVVLPNCYETKTFIETLEQCGLQFKHENYYETPLIMITRNEKLTYIVDTAKSVLKISGLDNIISRVQIGDVADGEKYRLVKNKNSQGKYILYLDDEEIRLAQNNLPLSDDYKIAANAYITDALCRAVLKLKIKDKGHIYESIVRGGML